VQAALLSSACLIKMKVLFDCHLPFMLAHGGAQIQIEQTMTALGKLGVCVEPLRWWDDAQSGDVLHHFARIPTHLQRLAQEKGMKVVMSAFVGGLGARPAWKRLLQKLALRAIRPVAPRRLRDVFDWDSYRLLDALIAMTPYEASLLTGVHRAPPSRVHVVPNGVEAIFLKSRPTRRGPWLVCTASVTELKGVLKLAQMAVQAETPVWIIGKAYSDADEYTRSFVEYARQNSKLVRYEGPIGDRERLAGIYREARGFVLLSQWESLSLSALEAAASGCPLLLSDLAWAHEAFKDKASYCPVNGSLSASVQALRRFYEAAPNLAPPPPPLSWIEVASQIKAIYESILKQP
jgi:glycosyltransferase involved in cell wall biosynthesis